MARIEGVNIPDAKKIGISIGYIYGIGRKNGAKILQAANVDPEKRTHALTEDELNRIREQIKNSNIKVEGELRREVQLNIKRLMDLACYRGLRHRKGLPVRGQRTHTNARTRKGPAVAIAGKKQASAKK